MTDRLTEGVPVPARLAVLLATASLVLATCGPATDSDGVTAPTDSPAAQTAPTATGHGALPAGLARASGGDSVEAVHASVVEALEANDAVEIVAQVDHAASAAGVGRELPPTRLVLFGNPTLGTPLMQASPRAGIDLPQRLLVWEDDAGDVHLAYNQPDHLASRHGLPELPELDRIAEALAGLARGATGAEPELADSGEPGRDEGLVVRRSRRGFRSTVRMLRSAIESADALTLVAVLDHRANAASVGQELTPATLLVFGNPRIGTPLMQAGRTVGVDLPQRLLVHEDADGTVWIVHEDPAHLAARHDLEGVDEQLRTVTTALAGLVERVAEEESAAASAPADRSR